MITQMKYVSDSTDCACQNHSVCKLFLSKYLCAKCLQYNNLPHFQDSAGFSKVFNYVCTHQRKTEYSNVNTGCL